MASWPENRRVIGTAVPRVDGHLKVSGQAKYSFDVNLPGMLHGKILRSPHAHAKIISIDTGPAEAMGVKFFHIIKKPGEELHYAGDEILALAAPTEEGARDAARAIEVKYQKLDHVASEEDGLKLGDPVAKPGRVDERGEGLEEALKGAAALIEGRYGANVITHVCLETHGLVAQWKNDELTVWCSTQGVGATADQLRETFNKPVKVITKFMGGGFGSKFGPEVHGVAAAHLALKAGAPVKMMLERAEEHNSMGNRPSAFARVKLGCDAGGKLVGIDAETWGTGGHANDSNFPLPYVTYLVPRRRRLHTNVFINAGGQRAMRAPGHPQGCFIMESAMDDLCHRFDPGLDPIEFRIRNLPPGNLNAIWKHEILLGAARIDWREKWHPRGDQSPGPWKRGLGCALGTWGGNAGGGQAMVTIHSDGKVEVKVGTQDLGTGTTTLVHIVAAEILGLQVKDIDGQIGDSSFPPAGPSGGSTSCGGVSLAVALACTKARDELLKLVAGELGSKSEELEAQGGRVHVKGDPEKGFTWKQACARIGPGKSISVSADKDKERDAVKGMSSGGVGGAQLAEVLVDVETGRVRLEKIVAVADCGLVMNRLLCESQVQGGVIGGINYALHEERRLDRATGLPLNPDMELYHLAGASDIPEIDVHLLDYPERGVIGIGEPPTIPTAAAIANAVANAIGVRVPELPLTPARVLAALSKQTPAKG